MATTNTNVKDTLITNIEQATITFQGNLSAYNTALTANANGTNAAAVAILEEKKSAMNASLKKLNDLLAAKEYRDLAILDIIKSGEVTAVATTEEDGSVKSESSSAHPTIKGLSDYIPGLKDQARLVYFTAVYVRMGETCSDRVAWVNDTKKDKSADFKWFREYLKEHTPSKTSVKKDLTDLFALLGITVEVSSKMLLDFNGFMTKRTATWGERVAVSESTFSDLVLEYANMLVNGKTAFTTMVK